MLESSPARTQKCIMQYGRRHARVKSRIQPSQKCIWRCARHHAIIESKNAQCIMHHARVKLEMHTAICEAPCQSQVQLEPRNAYCNMGGAMLESSQKCIMQCGRRHARVKSRQRLSQPRPGLRRPTDPLPTKVQSSQKYRKACRKITMLMTMLMMRLMNHQ